MNLPYYTEGSINFCVFFFVFIVSAKTLKGRLCRVNRLFICLTFFVDSQLLPLGSGRWIVAKLCKKSTLYVIKGPFRIFPFNQLT